MAALSGDYTGCSVIIYDTAGNHLGSTTVAYYEKDALRLELKKTPATLDVGDDCRLLIISEPSPCEYQGKVRREGTAITIALHHGKEKDNRRAVRYKIKHHAIIENLIFNNQAYRLHTPLVVALINISTNGVRFRAPYYALSDGDRFQMRMRIGDNEKLMIADVNNHADNNSETTEYGCRFLIGSESGV